MLTVTVAHSRRKRISMATLRSRDLVGVMVVVVLLVVLVVSGRRRRR
jgi:hypothetical protein